MQYLPFCVWLISLIIMPSKSIHVVANGRISFLFKGWIIFYCKQIPHFLYPFICHLDYFHTLAIVNNTTNMAGGGRCRYLSQIMIFFPLDIYPEVGLLDHIYFCFWHSNTDKTDFINNNSSRSYNLLCVYCISGTALHTLYTLLHFS